MSASGDPIDGIPFIQKPFKFEEFKQKLRQLLAA
jgi:hypothetical protein